MKAILITISLLTAVFTSSGDPVEYTEVMQQNIRSLYEARTMEALQASVHSFERISRAEPDKWRPLYYATFGYIMMGNQAVQTADKDKYLDKALETLKQAMEIEADESELVALEGFIHMIRTSVDPATRGQQYSGLAMQALNRAHRMDPSNPRAMSLLAQMQMGTARFFGSDISEPCDLLSQAIARFEVEKPAHPLDPVWGKENAMAARKACE